MEVTQVVDLGREALWVLVKVSAPVMLTALGVGLIISLFQALTQIQETTLTFVPKILSVFMVMILVMPFMLQSLIDFNTELYTLIGNLNNNE
jgi:flagellar biosynthesis protein FliQ